MIDSLFINLFYIYCIKFDHLVDFQKIPKYRGNTDYFSTVFFGIGILPKYRYRNRYGLNQKYNGILRYRYFTENTVTDTAKSRLNNTRRKNLRTNICDMWRYNAIYQKFLILKNLHLHLICKSRICNCRAILSANVGSAKVGSASVVTRF